jgi:phosphoserine phosphatase
MANIKVAFDVDGTLINFGDTPRYEIVNQFLFYKSLEHDVIIWSGGGCEHSKMVSERFGLAARIIEKWSEEVDIAYDDLTVLSEEKSLRKVAKVIIVV